MDEQKSIIEWVNPTEKTKNLLWIKAGGVCTRCNKYLVENAAGETVKYGEVAHNVGKSKGKGSPRSEDSNLPLGDRAKLNNLLLMCNECHDDIDGIDKDFWTVKRLYALKEAHESRIRMLTDFRNFNTSMVISVHSKIQREYHSSALPEKVTLALLDEELVFYPDRGGKAYLDIDLTSNDPKELKFEIDNAMRHYNKLVKENKFNITSVFGAAPIYALIYLGKALGDKQDIRPFPFSSETYKWANKTGNKFKIISPNQISSFDKAKEINIFASISGILVEKDVSSKFLKNPTYNIQLEDISLANREAISSKESLKNFKDKWEELLNKTMIDFPEVEKINLFGAIPTTAAISIGQLHRGDSHPTLVTYEKYQGKYSKALEIKR